MLFLYHRDVLLAMLKVPRLGPLLPCVEFRGYELVIPPSYQDYAVFSHERACLLKSEYSQLESYSQVSFDYSHVVVIMLSLSEPPLPVHVLSRIFADICIQCQIRFCIQSKKYLPLLDPPLPQYQHTTYLIYHPPPSTNTKRHSAISLQIRHLNNMPATSNTSDTNEATSITGP